MTREYPGNFADKWTQIGPKTFAEAAKSCKAREKNDSRETMSIEVISLPVRSGREWRYLTASVLLRLVLFLGLTLAAVLSIGLQRDCRVEQEYLMAGNGIYLAVEIGRFFVTGRESRRCELVWQPLFD
jgi:hypothetical protein